MKKLLPALLLLTAIPGMASNPESRILQQDNCPKTGVEQTMIRHKAKAATTDLREATRADEEEVKTHVVKIHIIHSELSRGISVFYFNESGFNMLQPDEFEYNDKTGILKATLPEGMLDLVVEFSNMYINQEAGYFVSRGESFYLIDDVEVNENTPVLKADANECRMLPVSFVLANGEPLVLGTKTWLGTEMGPETGGNCLSANFGQTFYNSKYKEKGGSRLGSGVPCYYKDFGLDSADDNPMTYWLPSVNKASDRWSFVMIFTTFTEDMQVGHVVVAVNPDTEPVEVTASDYNKIEWNFADLDLKGIEYDYGVSFGTIGETLESISDIFVSTPLDMFSAVVNRAKGVENLNLMFQTKAALEVDDSDPDWPDLYGPIAPLSNIYEDSREFHGGAYCFTALPKAEGVEYTQYLPEYTWGNEYANYTQKKLAMKFGDSTPFISTSLWRNEDHETDAVKGFLVYNYIFDLAGTERSGWDSLESEVYFNGKLVKDKGTSLDSFTYSWDSTTEGLGKMKYVFTDEPDFKVDGYQPVTTSEISYDQSIEAWEPPTLTSILFKNAEGEVTNQLSGGNGASVEIYGGSTQWNQHWENPFADLWFSQGVMTIGYDVDAKMEYAPYGSDNWQEISLTENEAERSPAYGNHYRGSLDDVKIKSETGWYDLRVTLTTPGGNSQVQTLSPAFQLGDMSGVETIESEQGARYYDLQGIEVRSPQKGQPVIRIDNRGAKKIIF